MNTYAIVEAGGEQLQVEPGRFYDIRLEMPIDELSKQRKIVFSRILMIRNTDGPSGQSNTFMGKPWLENATVKGRIFHQRRGNKMIVYNMRPKKHTSKKRAHRQSLLRFVVDAICLNNKTFLN
uniref:Large ribosomal subunit protein bL21c n=1 Tax=Closterium baillyanum TaxID=1416941 RepID=A0A191T5W5_9VIRI|nr:ribosomal protein L21 [Closterium baillyanum]ANI25784.1 ribosomal protein L21 [Closterium baillyanum]